MRLAAASGILGRDAACAVWYLSGVPDMCASDHELERYAEWFTLFGRIVNDWHPDRPPYDCLVLLGAGPEARGRGLGSALPRHRLASLDLVGVPIYLVATTRCCERGRLFPCRLSAPGRA